MSKITKIAIFDFDGTLVDTGTKETHAHLWKEKTGEDWPYLGWWGRKESLDMDVFNHPVFPDVIDAYNEVKGRDDVLIVMLTGRLKKLSGEVKIILGIHGLAFDQYLFNYGGETISNKTRHISDLLKDFPDVREVEMFEDRDEHIVTFKQLGRAIIERKRLDKFTIRKVDEGKLVD